LPWKNDREVRGFLDKTAADVAVLERLDTLLQTRREQMLRQVTALVREVESIYEETTKERTTLLRQELTWWRGFQLIWRRTGDHPDLHAKIETKLRQWLQPQMQPAVSKLEIDLRGLWPQMQDSSKINYRPTYKRRPARACRIFAGQRRELLESIQAAFIDILAGKTLKEQLARSYSQNGALVARCCRNNRDCRSGRSFSPELGAQRRPWQRLWLRESALCLPFF